MKHLFSKKKKTIKHLQCASVHKYGVTFFFIKKGGAHFNIQTNAISVIMVIINKYLLRLLLLYINLILCIFLESLISSHLL